MTRRAEEAAEIYTQLKKEARNIGLEINSQKTKTLTQTRTRGNKNYPREEDNVDAVQSFTYLGVELNTRGSEKSEKQSLLRSVPYIPLQNHTQKIKNQNIQNHHQVDTMLWIRDMGHDKELTE